MPASLTPGRSRVGSIGFSRRFSLPRHDSCWEFVATRVSGAMLIAAARQGRLRQVMTVRRWRSLIGALLVMAGICAGLGAGPLHAQNSSGNNGIPDPSLA